MRFIINKRSFVCLLIIIVVIASGGMIYVSKLQNQNNSFENIIELPLNENDFLFENEEAIVNINILDYMKDGLEDSLTSEIYKQDIQDVREMTYSKHIIIQYFDVDLNNDGFMDKIVLIASPLHSGAAGDTFDILLNDENEGYNNASEIVLRLYNHDESNFGDSYVFICKSKTNGFYDIEVKTDEYSFTLKYNDRRYDFQNQNCMKQLKMQLLTLVTTLSNILTL